MITRFLWQGMDRNVRIFVLLVLVLGAADVLFVLAAGAVESPYAQLGASRELVLLVAHMRGRFALARLPARSPIEDGTLAGGVRSKAHQPSSPPPVPRHRLLS